jgi:YD repeat-containing protein
MTMVPYHEPRAKRKHPARVVYDGRERLGSIEPLGDEFVAYDRRGQVIGRFDTAIDATNAVGKAAER